MKTVRNVTLSPYTREKCHFFYKNYRPDPMMTHESFVYSEAWVERYYQLKVMDPTRCYFAIEEHAVTVGEIQLKYIDEKEKHGTLSIVLANDASKNKGIGTEAIRLMLKYATEHLHLNKVYADAIHRNLRSQHVLEKTGFKYTHEDDQLKYYAYQFGSGIIPIVKTLDAMFNTKDKDIYLRESGISYDAKNTIKKIGYCVNITLETVEEARRNGVDLMVTHHDAWGEIYGLKEACLERLTAYGISHYYNHLPLDDCDFGTNDSLLKALNLTCVERTHEWEGLFFGRVAKTDAPIDLKAFVERVENTIGEPVRAWQFNDRLLQRVGLVCGNGAPTSCLREVVEKNCDVYITGECDLNTLQYAQLKDINLIIGSHTGTEVLGIEHLITKLGEHLKGLEMIKLSENLLELN